MMNTGIFSQIEKYIQSTQALSGHAYLTYFVCNAPITYLPPVNRYIYNFLYIENSKFVIHKNYIPNNIFYNIYRCLMYNENKQLLNIVTDESNNSAFFGDINKNNQKVPFNFYLRTYSGLAYPRKNIIDAVSFHFIQDFTNKRKCICLFDTLDNVKAGIRYMQEYHAEPLDNGNVPNNICELDIIYSIYGGRIAWDIEVTRHALLDKDYNPVKWYKCISPGRKIWSNILKYIHKCTLEI